MLLVVVGNIDRAHIERLVNKSIGQLSRGSYGWTPPPRVPESPTAVVVAPLLLLDPFGRILKIFPIMLTILFAIAISDDR